MIYRHSHNYLGTMGATKSRRSVAHVVHYQINELHVVDLRIPLYFREVSSSFSFIHYVHCGSSTYLSTGRPD